MNKIFKTKPRAHQLDEFELRKDLSIWATLWEMGSGKTKLTLDCMAHQYTENKINAGLIFAPNGVHENWTLDEIPLHWCEHIPYKFMTWHNGRSKTKKFKREFEELLKFDGMVFFAMNYEAWRTKLGKEFGIRFLKARKVFSVADESGAVKNDTTTTSKSCARIAPLSVSVRILNGTIIEDGPFDVYGQIKFLSQNFWLKHRIRDFWAFKHRYAEFEKKKIMIWDKNKKKYYFQEFNAVKEIKGKKQYKNLNELKRILGTVSSRVTKAQVLPHLPPKIFQKRYFEMSPNQKLAYDQIMKNYVMLIDEQIVTADMAITRELKYQQIINGYVATDDEGIMKDIPGPNPRLDLLGQIIEESNVSTIIWCRFQEDVRKVLGMLQGKKLTAGAYYGPTSAEDRLKLRKDFQDGKTQYFVGNEAASMGLTLHKSELVIFYSNSYKLKNRLQMEDRSHRDGLLHSVNYIDLVALLDGRPCIDGKLIDFLIAKKEIADFINDDEARDWL